MGGAAPGGPNPLTARYGIVHGHAVGVMLPHVVRFTSSNGQRPYADLAGDPEALARRLTELLKAGEIPVRLAEHGVKFSSIDDMAEMAATQWTATFNPRKVGPRELRGLYEAAM